MEEYDYIKDDALHKKEVYILRNSNINQPCSSEKQNLYLQKNNMECILHKDINSKPKFDSWTFKYEEVYGEKTLKLEEAWYL